MNDTGGGVTAIHDVPGDITRIGFHWMLFFPFSHSKGGFYLFFTRSVSEVTGFLCPEFANLRIFFSHGESRRSRIFLSRFFPCPEFANYRISFTRNVSEVTVFFFVPNFRIFEFFLHAENRGDHGFFLSRDLSWDPLTAGR